MKKIVFPVIFLVQNLALMLTGLSNKIFYELLEVSFLLETGFSIACLGFFICGSGILLVFLNRNFIKIKIWQFVLLIMSSSILIIFMFVLCFGSLEIGSIKIPGTEFGLPMAIFFASIFWVWDDPARALYLGLITIPALFIFTPVSFCIVNFIFKSTRKSS